MAFTEKYLQPQRWSDFSFFYNGGALTETISESLAPGVPFKLHEVRVHMSTAFISACDFIVRLSSIQGSAHNMTFLSYRITGSTDVWWLFSNPLLFQSDDEVVFTLVNSGANMVGINVTGWGAIG